MKIHLVTATIEDLQLIVDILNTGMRNKVRRGDLAWGMTDLKVEPIKQMIANSMFYIAYNESTPVGTCALSWEDPQMWGKQPNDAGYIQRFATSANYKGQGVGGQIIKQLLIEVSKMNRQYLRLAVPSSNMKLRTYYENQGFVRADYRIASPIYPAYSAAYYEQTTSMPSDTTPVFKSNIFKRFFNK